jgi:sugar phosphate isomerase/epimerase
MYPSWNARAVGLDLSAIETMEIAARAGFAGVDLLVRDLVESGEDPTRVRDRMDELGIRGGAWPLPVNWRDDEARFIEDLRQLPRHAKAAAILGLFRTGTWVLPAIDPSRAGHVKHEDLIARTAAFHVDRLGKIAKVLADHDIRLGLEVLGPDTTRKGRGAAFVHRYAHLADRLGALKEEHSNVGVLVDAFQLFAAGEVCEAGFVWGDDSVVWVHLADSGSPDRAGVLDQDRALPGETGWADCRELIQKLAERAYDGPVTAEPLHHCKSLKGLNSLATARRTLGALRSVWPDNRPPEHLAV